MNTTKCGLWFKALDYSDTEVVDEVSFFLSQALNGDPRIFTFDRGWPSRRRWIVARNSNEEIVGLHRLIFVGRIGLLRFLYVDKRFRGHGVGRGLIAATLKEALEQKATKVIGWAWEKRGEREMLENEFRLMPLQERFWRYTIRIPDSALASTGLRVLALTSIATCSPAVISFVRRVEELKNLSHLLPGSIDGDSGFVTVMDDRDSLVAGGCFIDEGSRISFFGFRMSMKSDRSAVLRSLMIWSGRRGAETIEIPIVSHDFESTFSVFSLGGTCLLDTRVGLSCLRLSSKRR